MKKNATVLLIIAAILLTPAMALAGDASPWTNENSYQEKVMAKLDYGVKNLLGGWTEIITKPIAYYKDDNENVVEGLGRGAWNAVAYTLGGVVHTATFLCPTIDVPIKDQGVDF